MPNFTPVLVSEVNTVFPSGLTDTEVQSFIDATEALFEQEFKSADISDDLVHELEIFVTAHFISSTRAQQLDSAEAGPVKAKFEGSTGRMFQGTRFGLMAMQLDPTGILSQLDRTRRRPLYFQAIATTTDGD